MDPGIRIRKIGEPDAMAAGNHRYLVQLPDGWSDQTIHTFMGPDEGGLQHQILLGIDETGGGSDLESYAEERIQAHLTAQPELETLKREASVLPSGDPVYEWTFKLVTSDDAVLFHRMLFLKRHGCLYSFSGSFTKKTLQTLGSDFVKLVDSLQRDGGA